MVIDGIVDVTDAGGGARELSIPVGIDAIPGPFIFLLFGLSDPSPDGSLGATGEGAVSGGGRVAGWVLLDPPSPPSIPIMPIMDDTGLLDALVFGSSFWLMALPA